MAITMLLAVSQDGVIGKDGQLPWKLPNDLKRFKKLTIGNTVVMGRKTWESLPKKPLPDRQNVVLSNNPTYQAHGAEVYSSDDVSKIILQKKRNDFMVIGGSSIYRIFLPYADKIELTLVHHNFDGDTFFVSHMQSDWLTQWKLLDRRDHDMDETHAYPYSFLTYEQCK